MSLLCSLFGRSHSENTTADSSGILAEGCVCEKWHVFGTSIIPERPPPKAQQLFQFEIRQNSKWNVEEVRNLSRNLLSTSDQSSGSLRIIQVGTIDHQLQTNPVSSSITQPNTTQPNLTQQRDPLSSRITQIEI